MDELREKIQDNLDGANILMGSGLYKQAAPLLWNAVRSAVFLHLNEKEESFSSTKEALVKIVKMYQGDSSLCDNIIFIETVSLLCEWDEYFSISDSQIKRLKDSCTDVVAFFTSTTPLYNQQTLYHIYKEEIERHLEDSGAAKSTQYAAATRNEKYYDLMVTISFILTLIGVSAFLYTFLNMECLSKYSILGGQFLTLLAAGVSLWSLIQNFQAKADAHRRCAEEYNKIWKKCTNWKTDFPNGENISDLKNHVLSIRDSIHTANYFSLATKRKDYLLGKKDRERGSYIYSSVKTKNNN